MNKEELGKNISTAIEVARSTIYNTVVNITAGNANLTDGFNSIMTSVDKLMEDLSNLGLIVNPLTGQKIKVE